MIMSQALALNIRRCRETQQLAEALNLHVASYIHTMPVDPFSNARQPAFGSQTRVQPSAMVKR